MQVVSLPGLPSFRKLGTIIIAIALAGCGGGGGGGSGGTPSSTPSITGTESVLYSFAGATADGGGPYGGLVQASDGNFYGMTSGGGTSSKGTVFKITPAGTETVLYSFAGSTTDGASPIGNLIQASDGNLYGMTQKGGASNNGTVFKITLAGTETVLHSFPGATADGFWPSGSLIQASDGNLYGMTYAGGNSGAGTVFKITTGGVETVLHSFAGDTSDGGQPQGSLIQASDGNLYGMATNGGAHSAGDVFKITTTGTETVLYSFAGGTTDGAHPYYGNLIQASDGNLYGMTLNSGASNWGTVFRITTAGTETVLYSFAGGTTDGWYPWGSLLQAKDGNLYGLTYGGGSGSWGTVFRITTAGTETVLHSFTSATTDGANPWYGSLAQASDGSLYGMTSAGGVNSLGSVFRIVTNGKPAGTTETVLYSFVGGTTDGASPDGSLIQASDGTLYGMTSAGGVNSLGSVFRIFTNGTPTGTAEILLYSFVGGSTDGASPDGSLIQASDGNFYGMTSAGGANGLGTVFKVTTTGTPAGTTVTLLHSFAGTTDGSFPYGSLIQASDGNLYGMTLFGGASNNGAVFKITMGGTFTLLYSFAGTTDGANPYGDLVQASDGNFYGMTQGGGASGLGTVFRITTAGTRPCCIPSPAPSRTGQNPMATCSRPAMVTSTA